MYWPWAPPEQIAVVWTQGCVFIFWYHNTSMYYGRVKDTRCICHQETRASRATHYTSENITKDGTQTVWMASSPDGTREAHNEASDGSVCVAFNIAVDLA